jgi:hypothetical protein
MRRIPLTVGILVLTGLLCAPRSQQPPRTSAAVKAAADSARRLRVVVSLADRRLWALSGLGDTLRTAPVAVGSNRTLRSGTRHWTFATPVGIRAVTSVEKEPVWIRPDWAYVELARERKLKLDSVTPSRPRLVAGGQLVVRGMTVGIVRDSTFQPWPANEEIIVSGTLFIPPLGTPYRAVPAFPAAPWRDSWISRDTGKDVDRQGRHAWLHAIAR